MRRLLVVSTLWLVAITSCRPTTTSALPTDAAKPTVVISALVVTTRPPTPTIAATSTPASALCPSLSITPPSTSHFNPIDGAGAIAYSGDGISLAFPATGVTVTIHTISQLSLDGADWAFAWSPDATQIAFLHTVLGPPRECLGGYLMLADLGSGEIRRLLETPGIYSRPVWSPDGERLAFSEVTGSLQVLQVSNGTLLTLSQDAFGAEMPTWIDAEHVVYARHSESGGAELVSQPLDGSTPSILLTDAPSGDGSFDISPDGRQLAYLGAGLRLVDLKSGNERSLGFEPSLDRLQWSPNSRYLLVHGGLAGVYLIRPDSDDAIAQLDFFGVPGVSQAWAPDGGRFAVLSGPEGETPHIGIYDVDAAKLSELLVEVQRPFDLAWSTR